MTPRALPFRLTSPMVYSLCSRILLLSLGFIILLNASASALADPRALQLRHEDDAPSEMPDSHAHSQKTHHSQPLDELDEAEVLRHHPPDPLSYWAHDFESHSDNEGGSSGNWRGLMGLHVVGMSLAFFVLLPVGKRPGQYAVI